MKIALYEMTVTLSYGGIQTSYWETARRLAGMGHTIHIYGAEGPIRREVPPGVAIFMFPFVDRRSFPALGSRFRKFAERITFGRNALDTLLRNRYDVIYIRKPYEFPISLYARRKTGAKVVYRSGGTEFYPGYGHLASRLDALLACSRYNAGQIRAYCGLEPEVLYNGVDTDRFVPLPRSREVTARLGLSDRDIVVMSVGRLVGWKGFQYGIRAVSLLSDRNVKYVIVGNGEFRRELEREAGALGIRDRVVFAGFVEAEEMPAWYSVADVVLFPTIGNDDAFPNTLCEAMACGKPVVGTRKGGIPEGIEEGETGLVVEARDPGALAAALGRILQDPERRGSMGRRARERATEHFSWDTIVKRLEGIFLSLIDDGRQGG